MTAIALAVYAVLLAAAAVVVWRRPVYALYLFVVGLALHNAAMDALFAAGVDHCWNPGLFRHGGQFLDRWQTKLTGYAG